MKLIIDIPEERLDSIKHFGIKQNEVSMLERALISGTPFDNVKAEIKTEYNSIPWRNSNYDDGRLDALRWVFTILDRIGKESEDKRDERR